MLRDGVLEGRAILLSGADPALEQRLARLGAALAGAAEGGGALADDAPVQTLVVDARGAFAAAGAGYEGLRAAVDGTFALVRDTALAHWIDQPGGGQAVLLAPAPGAGRHAGAARAALENLVRTLSTEWARHGVTTVAVLPADGTSEAELADLVAWLATPAGAYLSGTALTLS